MEMQALEPAGLEEELYNPPDDLDTVAWMKSIGQHVGMVEPWVQFATHIVKVTMASDIGDLRLARKNDIETARANAGVSVGFVNAIRKRLRPKGTPVSGYFNFVGADAVAESAEQLRREKYYGKKFTSQRDRQALGAELGPATLASLELPAWVLAPIKLAEGAAMKARGKNSTEAVADQVYVWAIGEWANLHADEAFCDRMHELLTAKYPNLKPWGANAETPRTRTWFDIIKNRFSNARCAEPVCALHTVTTVALPAHACSRAVYLTHGPSLPLHALYACGHARAPPVRQ